MDGQRVASISREIGANENTIHKMKKEKLSVKGGLKAPQGGGEVIFGDIKYLPMRGGRFCYLAAF